MRSTQSIGPIDNVPLDAERQEEEHARVVAAAITEKPPQHSAVTGCSRQPADGGTPNTDRTVTVV
jgi:hypothetical protein